MTPMTEIEKLKDGVYEKVMSRRFAEVLKEALAEDQVRAEEEDVDAEEAVGYLSSYLQRVIRLCLKDIADRDEEDSVDHQLALTNELIASLAKKIEELGGGQEVANAPFLLRSLEHKKNTLLPRRWERPATSLTRSFLFTNSKKDVSMVHELTKEIASSDTSRRYWMHLIQSAAAKIAGTILSSPLQARERQRSPPSTIADLPPREKKGRASSSSLIGKRS